MSPRQRVGRRSRREQLISTAIRLIDERGIANVRPTAVAEESGVSTGLFYYYFPDMDTLVRELVVDARHSLRRGLADAVAGITDPLERLYVASKQSALMSAANPIMRMLTWSDEANTHTPSAEEMHQTTQILVDDAVKLLAEGQALGAIRRDVTTLHLAYCVRAVVHYNLTSYLRGQILGSIEELADTIASFVIRGVCTNLTRAEEIERRLGGTNEAAAYTG